MGAQISVTDVSQYLRVENPTKPKTKTLYHMKIQITLVTAALLRLAAGDSPELNPASFDEAIHAKNTFVKFYAPVSVVT